MLRCESRPLCWLELRITPGRWTNCYPKSSISLTRNARDAGVLFPDLSRRATLAKRSMVCAQCKGLTCEDGMPLNETDKSWIREQIQLATKRQGWGKLTGFLKDWSGAGAAITILVFFFTQYTTYVEFRTRTSDRLDAIERALPWISANLELLKPHAGNTLPQVMKDNLSAQKNKELGLKTVAALAIQARESNVEADPKQIATVGDQLTSSQTLFTQKNSADAWHALTGLLSYYSALHALPSELKPLPFAVPHYDFGGTNGREEKGTIMYTGGLVPLDQAAVAEHIVSPERNPYIKEAPQTIIYRADSQDEINILDGHHLKNIVLVNITVYYGGGPVILENVTFVNCIFTLAQQDKCVSFGRSLFASNPVTFHTTG
jgi:hypothetical protein